MEETSCVRCTKALKTAYAAPAATRARSLSTVTYLILEAATRWMAPVAVFTAPAATSRAIAAGSTAGTGPQGVAPCDPGLSNSRG